MSDPDSTVPPGELEYGLAVKRRFRSDLLELAAWWRRHAPGSVDAIAADWCQATFEIHERAVTERDRCLKWGSA